MKWPDNWRRKALESAQLPVTSVALEVLSAWRKSTPLQPWTNNPIGMPARENGAMRAAGTDYASFRTFQTFYKAFERFMKSATGQKLAAEIANGGNPAEAWRIINSLNWPGNKTESEYPSALLDLVQAKYTDKMPTVARTTSKTSGNVGASASVHDAIKAQQAAIHDATKANLSGVKAMQMVIRRLG